jgi:hypothetical protein
VKRQRVLTCIIIVGTGFCLAQAATITSYNRATFQAALSGGTVSGQNFDSISGGTVLTTLNGVTYGASIGSPAITGNFLTTTPLNGLGSTSQASIFFADNETATFTFASPITAFAIDVNTFAPTAGDYTATLNLGNIISSKFDVFPGTSTGQFLGFTSDTPFSSVTINPIMDPNSTRYTYTLDTLVFGSAEAVASASVPEPSTMGFLGAGLALLALKIGSRFNFESR